MFENYKFKDFVYHSIKKWYIVLCTSIIVFISIFMLLSNKKVEIEKNHTLKSAFIFKAKEDTTVYTSDGHQKSTSLVARMNSAYLKSELFSEQLLHKLKEQSNKSEILKELGIVEEEPNSQTLAKFIKVVDTGSEELLEINIMIDDINTSKILLESLVDILKTSEMNRNFLIEKAGEVSFFQEMAPPKMKPIVSIFLAIFSISIGLLVVLLVTLFTPTINDEKDLKMFSFGRKSHIQKTLGNINYFIKKNNISKLAIVNISKHDYFSDINEYKKVNNYFNSDENLDILEEIKNVIIVIELGKTKLEKFDLLVSELEKRDINICGCIVV